MVARHEHERLADSHDAAHQRGLERAAAVGQVADEEDRPVGGGALEDREVEDVVVEVGGDREARPVLERGAVRRAR